MPDSAAAKDRGPYLRFFHRRFLAHLSPVSLAILLFLCIPCWSQSSPISTGDGAAAVSAPSLQAAQGPRSTDESASHFEGLPVNQISFEGVPADRLGPVTNQLVQAVGKPLRGTDMSRSLRQLYATNLYNTIEVRAQRAGDGVNLVFSGEPRLFIGTVSVDGAKGATVNTQLERASWLEPGTRFTQAKLDQAIEQMRTTLAGNGFRSSTINDKLTPHPDEQLVDIAFAVNSGPQARLGTVQVTGDAGMSVEQFRREAHLKAGVHVDHDTVNRALDGVLRHYQSQERLEADVKLAQEQYDSGARAVNLQFTANRGPVVKVQVEGAGIHPGSRQAPYPHFSGRYCR